MDLLSVRLGFAHYSLLLTLGDDLFPVSFSDQGFVFIHRKNGQRLYCLPENAALKLFPVDENGSIQQPHQELMNLTNIVEPIYLMAWQNFFKQYELTITNELKSLKNNPALNSSASSTPLEPSNTSSAPHLPATSQKSSESSSSSLPTSSRVNPTRLTRPAHRSSSDRV